MRFCCIQSCRHNRKKHSCRFHRFPNNPETCTEWVRVVGDCDFLHLNIDTLHRKKYVCSCHFIDENYITPMKMHLKNEAVPSIFNEKTHPLSDEDMKIFSSPEMTVSTISLVTPLSNLENLKNVHDPPKIIKRKATDLNSKEEVSMKRIQKSEKSDRALNKLTNKHAAINCMTEIKSVNTVKILRGNQRMVLKPCSLIKILKQNLDAMNLSSAQELIMRIELLLSNHKKQIDCYHRLKNIH